jgi:hypothetical protein
LEKILSQNGSIALTCTTLLTNVATTLPVS